ncbi:MAG: PEGA domain-containing protein [Planctomycetes bacterium]|nr:PEGA domain-containing protein [Planctomycetota bacterium]
MPPGKCGQSLLRRFAVLLALAALAGATGCVERRLIINTEPHPAAVSAIVYDENNRSIGATPTNKMFEYYGTYRFRIVKDGYETLVVDRNIRAPWYEWAGLDFISENLIPWTIRDVRYLTFTLQPLQVRSPEQLLLEGQFLRDYGRTIGEPLPDAGPITPSTVLGPPMR